VGAMAQPGTATSQVDPGSGQGAVARRRLFDVLSTAQRVTHVSAPAGAGKSVLLRSWIADAGLGGRTAWVSVGREERDPQRFWLSVLRSVRGTDGGSELVRAVTGAPALDGWSIVERLVGDLSALEGRLWLVIDDLHELQAGDALEQLELLLTRAPAQLRFVLSGRRDVRLGLHRLRLEGELTEIRGRELRFTLHESRALFQAAGVRLSDRALESLVGRTEGWGAGLRLAALSLAGDSDPERFAADFSGSDRTVAEFLLAEVLDRQPPDVSRLLLRTSILERINGPLADRLTGDTGAQRILAEMEESNGFVVALDPQRTWFRYHRLFADLLALELRRTASGELRDLHTSAAEWFAEHGHPVEAIRHAQAAEDWSLAARLLSDYWFGMYLDGGWATAHELLSAFPPATAMENPELASIAAADEVTGGSLEEAARYVALAARECQSVPEDRRGRFQLRLASLRLQLARARNDITVAAREAEQLLVLVESDKVPPGTSEAPRAMTLLTLGRTGIWTGQHEEAERHLEQALALARRTERPFIELGAQAHLALLARSRLAPLAEKRARQAIELARDNGWEDDTFAGVAFAVLGNVTLWRGRLSEAEHWIARAEHALRTSIEPATGLMLHTNRALLESARGRHDEAQAAFRAAHDLEAPLVMHWMAPFLRAHMLVAQVGMGQIERVQNALAEMDDETLDELQIRVVRAALGLAQDQPEEAVATLAPVLENPDARPLLPLGDAVLATDLWRMIPALLLGAIALDALRDPGGASRALERALDLAETNGLLLPFLWFPAADLLERHMRLRTAHASLVAEILDLLAGQAPVGPPGDAAPLSEPLSDAELRVLRYLPTNLQAPEIAAELFVSVNTIRTHMRHLYAKLGVHTRASAVERGRELRLLGPSSRTA
jgi:LuxR family transcriptional regulator, maltose regulon positive regulatory protein